MNESLQTERVPLGHRVPFRSVGLPAEHGSWSLVSEPILLGLLVAPSWAGAAVAVGAFALFLFNRPFKLFWSDRRRGRSYGRTAQAQRYALIYGLMSLAGFLLAWLLAGPGPFLPLLLALPFLGVFLMYDQRPGRFWQAELAAPAGFAAVVAAIALAGGWERLPALALWGFMCARAVPAILFIRARLRLDKGKAAGPGETTPAVIVAHGIALAAVVGLVWPGWLPMTGVLAALILLGRAIWGLSPWRWRSSVKGLGFLETGFGLLSVVLVAAGYWAGW